MKSKLGIFVGVTVLGLVALTCGDSGSGGGGGGGGGDPTVEEAWADHNLGGAMAAYAAAVDANPNDLQARFGLALTKVLMLPEHSSLNTFFTTCGQPGFDIQNDIFGPNGFIAHLQTMRGGTSSLSFQSGLTAGSMSPKAFAPNIIETERNAFTGAFGSEVYIDISLEDFRSPDLDGGVELYFYADTSDPQWMNGGSYTFPASNLSVGMWVDNSGGDFFDVKSGTVNVVQAGTNEGESIQLSIQNLQFERLEWNGSSYDVTDVYEFSGTLTDTITGDFSIPDSDLPFGTLTYDYGPPEVAEIIRAMELCGAGIGVPYLLSLLDDLVTEVNDIKAHLDVIAASSNPDAFVFNLPVGAMTNKVAIPVGAVALHGMRAFLTLFDMLNTAVQQYHYMDDDFVDMIATFTHYGRGVQVRDMDPELMATPLNDDFLRPQSTLDMGPMRTAYLAVISAIEDGLTAVTSNSLLNFQAAAAQTGTTELTDFLALLTSAATSTQALPDTPEYEILISNFFTNPPNRADLRTAVGGDIWTLTPRNAGTFQDASIDMEQTAIDEIVGKLASFPTGPSSFTPCSVESDCTSIDATWTCNFGGCEVRDPVFFDEMLVDTAYNGSPPTFVNETALNAVLDGF